MTYLLDTLRFRNEPLYYFGLICMLAGAVCLVLTRLTTVEIKGVNAWYKPFKFFLSTGIFAWTMAWYLYYLGPLPLIPVYTWSVVILLGLEVIYIAVQAGRGQLSHFNQSSPLYIALFGAMGLAAVAVALATAYIGLLFWQQPFPGLPGAYVWGIRLGIGLFFLFALEGLAMGGRLSHTVGGSDGTPGLPVVNWSRTKGDLRIAHFLGMHALQILPFLSFYLLKTVPLTLLAGLLYAVGVTLILVQALRGKPLWPAHSENFVPIDNQI